MNKLLWSQGLGTSVVNYRMLNLVHSKQMFIVTTVTVKMWFNI